MEALRARMEASPPKMEARRSKNGGKPARERRTIGGWTDSHGRIWDHDTAASCRRSIAHVSTGHGIAGA
eukprot:1881452-Rhodomonas_salina.1